MRNLKSCIQFEKNHSISLRFLKKFEIRNTQPGLNKLYMAGVLKLFPSRRAFFQLKFFHGDK